MSTNLFVYGTLMFPEIWGMLVEADYPSAPVVLPGYRRTRIVGDCYPVIRPGHHSDTVTGQTYRDISSTDLHRLDLFEGPFYERQCVRALSLSVRRKPVSAFAYVLRHRYRHLASAWPWHVRKARLVCRLRFLANTQQQPNTRHSDGHPAHTMEKA